MATGFSKEPNRIMRERIKGTTDEDIKSLVQKQAAAGEYPAGKVYIESDSTDSEGLRRLVFFQKETGMWVFQQSVNGRVQNRFEASTRDELFAAIDTYAKEVEDANDPVVITCKRWMQESKFGREFSTFQCRNSWLQLEERMNDLGLDVSIPNLDQAYAAILDDDNVLTNWHRFIQKRDRLERERLAATAATPHENLGDDNSARKSEDNSNRAKDLKTLRREAIFETKGERTPSTGTRLR